MTSLAASLSIDQRGPSALYIITDSRITWEASTKRWDSGQKAFASRTTPDIFGFCGDAYFPPAILRQILEQLDIGLLGATNLDVGGRHACVVERLQHAISKRADAPMVAFSVFHGAREGEFMKSRFCLWETRYSVAANHWSDKEHDLSTDHSCLVHIDGSGRNIIENKSRDWISTKAEGTSRAAIWSFCDALASGKDHYSGGPPQLVGVWRKGPAKNFGFVWEGKRYVAGLELPDGAIWNKVEWFNRLFERCDGQTGNPLEVAQRHKKPMPNCSP
jgi:hypothetical protein